MMFLAPSLKFVSRFLTTLLVLSLVALLPARAQQVANPAPLRPLRLQPLFGNLTVAQATQLLGESKLRAIAASFGSPAEASAFFATKGYEYLAENQPDTATYRFNLAWLLNPQNADAYRGLGIVASAQPTPDAAIALLTTALPLAPGNSQLLSDLGTSYLIRYGQQAKPKKKDLALGLQLLERATTLDATNAVAWQQLAHGLYYQEKYAEAWAAVHKGQALSFASTDFNFLSELLTKMPDPQGTISGDAK